VKNFQRSSESYLSCIFPNNLKPINNLAVNKKWANSNEKALFCLNYSLFFINDYKNSYICDKIQILEEVWSI